MIRFQNCHFHSIEQRQIEALKQLKDPVVAWTLELVHVDLQLTKISGEDIV